MLRTLLVAGLAGVLGLGGVCVVEGDGHATGQGGVQTTHRRVRGIITAVDDASVTIAPVRGLAIVSGRVDARTRIALDGKVAQASDLQISYGAKGELGLDDVWLAISATR
jgi:hypothetical protein